MENSSKQDIVQLTGVSKNYGDVEAVRDVSLRVKRGEFLTLLGPSGSGKTTILMMIAGFTNQTRGEILIRGRPISSKKPYQRDVGMVFQSLALFPHMNVEENIQFPLKMKGFPGSQIADRVNEVLDLVHLPGLNERGIQELSGGQQQRVALARALVFEPSVLLLDEALGALDRELRKKLQVEIKRIQEELEVTTISVTHDQKEALVMSDRICVINQGELEQIAPTREVYFHPRTKFVASFIGQTNILNAECISTDLDKFEARLGNDHRVEGLNRDGFRPGESLLIGIKAEQVAISSSEYDKSPNTLPGEVLNRVFEGERTIYEVSVKDLDQVLTVYEQNDADKSPYQPGQQVTISWDKESPTVIAD
ncbi:MAG: ABC transporter ATP-binding protein [Candidatus Acetothermia bacterium]